MKRNLLSMVCLGNIGISTAPSKRLDSNGLLKFLHTGFLVAASAFITFLINSVVGLNFYPDSTTDEMLITMFLVPALKLALTYFPNYSNPVE